MKIKVRCTEQKRGEKYFAIGKIYEWEDDILINDNGYAYSSSVMGTDPSKWDLSKWYEFEVVSDQKKIVITTDGKETLARLYEDNKVVKTASAKCSPSDEFNFETGAKIAFDRLVVEEPKIEIGKKYKLKGYDEVKDHIGITRGAWDIVCKKAVIPMEKENSGNYFTKCDAFGNHFIFHPEAFAGEWVEPKFTPHMYLLGTIDYGLLGYPTRYKDAVGQALVVGDTVTLFKDGEDHGEHAIVRYDGKTFVMGIECSCNNNGEIKNGWQIVKKRSYKDVGDGEEVSNVIYKKSAK